MLKYEESGNESFENVIMVSGLYFPNSFMSVAELSAKYHVIIPELHGFGENTDTIFEVDKMYDELTQLCEKFAPCHIVGFSIGADLVVKLICEKPDLFRSAILISPALDDKENYIKERLPLIMSDLKRMRKPFFSKLIAKLNAYPKEELKAFSESMKNVSEESVKRSVNNGITFESVPGFAELRLPVLVMVGGKEAKQIISTAKRMAKMNTNCQCSILKNGDHNIPLIFGKALLTELYPFYENNESLYFRAQTNEPRAEIAEK